MARKAEAPPGARFGQLVVAGELELRGDKLYAPVRCDCGTEKTIRVSTLGTTTRSCGCLNRKLLSQRSRSHGLSRTREYRIWGGMIQRCHNPKSVNYPSYGARGIAVCQRWRDSFEAFLADMGPRPTPEHSLDRLDNDRGYEPGNVAWRTRKEQAANRRPQLRDSCANGHDRTPENVRVDPDGSRTCRACERAREPLRPPRRRGSKAAAVKIL